MAKRESARGSKSGNSIASLERAGHEFIRSTSYGSHMGSRVVPDYVFGWTDAQDAVHVQTYNPTGLCVSDIHYTREAAETLARVLALALGWPHIPGEE